MKMIEPPNWFIITVFLIFSITGGSVGYVFGVEEHERRESVYYRQGEAIWLFCNEFESKETRLLCLSKSLDNPSYDKETFIQNYIDFEQTNTLPALMGMICTAFGFFAGWGFLLSFDHIINDIDNRLRNHYR